MVHLSWWDPSHNQHHQNLTKVIRIDTVNTKNRFFSCPTFVWETAISYTNEWDNDISVSSFSRFQSFLYLKRFQIHVPCENFNREIKLTFRSCAKRVAAHFAMGFFRGAIHPMAKMRCLVGINDQLTMLKKT